MPEEIETPAKSQEKNDGFNAPIAASISKPPKKEPKDEENDDDNLPLAVTKAKKKKPITASEVKKEEIDSGEDEKPLKGKSNAKTLKAKKEEIDSDEEAKPRKKENSSAKPLKVKKEESRDLDSEEEEEKKKTKKKKKEQEKKGGGKVGKAADSKGKEKREKKVYDLPGQKHDPPEKRDPSRIFYESLYRQMPNSEMATFWMMEWGLLPKDEAQKVYEKKLLKSKLGSPVKAVSVKKTTGSVKRVNKTTTKTLVKSSKKRKACDSDEDDDFVSIKQIKKKKKING